MNFQCEIFKFLLLLLIASEISVVYAVTCLWRDANTLSPQFIKYMNKVRVWSKYRTFPNSETDAVKVYETYLGGTLIRDISTFETYTRKSFDSLIYDDVGDGTGCSIDFVTNPNVKTAAIIQLCEDIESMSPTIYHAPNIPLIGYLKSLYQKSSSNLDDFKTYCETAKDDRPEE